MSNFAMKKSTGDTTNNEEIGRYIYKSKWQNFDGIMDTIYGRHFRRKRK